MVTPRHAVERALRGEQVVLPIALGLAVMAVAAFMVTIDIGPRRSINGLTVEGKPVGGLTRPQVAEAIAPLIRVRMAAPIELYYRENLWRIRPAEAGVQFLATPTVDAVMAVGRRGRFGERFQERIEVWRRGRDIALLVNLNRVQYDTLLTVVRSATDKDAVNAGWRLQPDGTVTVTPGGVGSAVRTEELTRRLLQVAKDLDARREIPLPVYTVHPRISTEKAVHMGITGVVSRYRTFFKTVDSNRVGNVRLAAQAVDQAAVLPGEVFSFNREVGPRIPESGYREAPVVVNGRLVPGVGGGVCQVSSTLYNAVLLAGVKTVKRSRHSIAAAYVPPGRDATVAYGYLDYQFQNNTPYALVVDTEVGPNWVEARLLGRPDPARTVEIEAITERVIAPGVVEKPDKELPFGRRVLTSKGAPGFKVRVWRIFKESGFEIRRELVSTDEYLPLDGIVKVGTSHQKGTP